MSKLNVIKEEPMYRTLPVFLTISNSTIEGLGLFSTCEIPDGTLLGITHHLVNNEIIRTPLGGFYNRRRF